MDASSLTECLRSLNFDYPIPYQKAQGDRHNQVFFLYPVERTEETTSQHNFNHNVLLI